MIKWLHIIGVGTSLLRNFETSHRDEAERLGVTGWYRLSPEHPDQHVAREEADKGFDSQVFRKLYDFLEENPRAASAELNAFLTYTNYAGHAPPSSIGVLLYTTDTGVSWLVGRVLEHYLRFKGYAVEGVVRVKGLGRSVEKFEEGLVNLVDEVVSRIIDARSRGILVYVNATSGYKAETIFMVIASLLAGATTIYYIHEAFREPVRIPMLPLSIKEQLARLLSEVDGLDKPVAEEKIRDAGYNPRILAEMGVIDEIGGVVKVREWVRRIISLIGLGENR